MRLRRTLGVLVALVLVGCGSGKSKSANTVTGETGSAVTGDLAAHLLAVPELPSGFSLDTASSSSDSSDDFCNGDLDIKNKVQTERKTEASFKQGGESLFSGTQVEEALLVYRGSSEAKRAVTAAQDALNKCKKFDTTDDKGNKTSGSISALSFPSLGDDTLALKLRAHVSSGELKGFELDASGDFVVVRRGDSVMFLANIVLGKETDAKLTESLARKASAKMIANNPSPPGQESPKATTTTEPTTTTTTEPLPQPVGGTQTTPTGKITVRAVQDNVPPADQFQRPQQGTRFYSVDIEACGTTGRLDVNPFNFQLQMDDNTRAEQASASRSPELHGTTVGPGDCVRGFIMFEVPTARHPVALLADFHEDVTYKWKL